MSEEAKLLLLLLLKPKRLKVNEKFPFYVGPVNEYKSSI